MGGTSFEKEYKVYVESLMSGTHIDGKAKLFELIDIFCDEGERYAYEGKIDESIYNYRMSVSLCKLCLRTYDEYAEIEKKLAKSMHLLGKVMNNGKITWKAFVIAHPYTDDPFCNIIRELAIKEYKLTDESLKMIESYRSLEMKDLWE